MLLFPGWSGPIPSAQVAAEDPRAQAGVVHPVGARVHPGGAVAPLALRARLAQSVGPAARQPYQYIFGNHFSLTFYVISWDRWSLWQWVYFATTYQHKSWHYIGKLLKIDQTTWRDNLSEFKATWSQENLLCFLYPGQDARGCINMFFS